MASHFNFTVPDSKEQFNRQIRKLAQSKAKELEVLNTKDGTVYMLEFDTDIQKKTFEVELSTKFPFLYY